MSSKSKFGHGQLPDISVPEFIRKQNVKMLPLEFLEDITNSVEEHTCDLVDSLENTIQSRKEFKTKQKDVINQGLEKVLVLLQGSVDKKFDLFEEYLKENISSISEVKKGQKSPAKRKSVTTVKQKGKKKSPTKGEQQLQSELQGLKEKIAEAENKKGVLKRKTNDLYREVESTQQFAKKLKIIPQICEENELESLPSALQEIIDQSGKLYNLLLRMNRAQERMESNSTEDNYITGNKKSPITSKTVRAEDLKRLNTHL